MAELAFMLPSLLVPSSSSHFNTRSSFSPLLMQNGGRSSSRASCLPQHGALFVSKPFPYPHPRKTAGVTACASLEDEASQISLELKEEEQFSHEEEGAGSDDDEKLQEDLKEKADQILKDAINKFSQSEIEDAAKQYDMEDELFAEIDYAQINAFTDRPFAGNPAAVCYLPLKRSDQWLQLVAREFNLSETAFLRKVNARKTKSPVFQKTTEEELAEENTAHVDEFDLRWFTPKFEVDLCGHATLASAHLLFTSGIAAGDTILFHTKSGILKAKKVSGYDKNKEEDKSEFTEPGKKRPIGVGTVELDFPLVSSEKCDDKEAEDVSAALGGVKLLWAGKTGSGDYLAEVSSKKELERLQPQFSHMLTLPGRGVIATARAENDSGLDFVSRFFAPKAGFLEDPVTGSAHCALGPFWAERFGKPNLKAYQASERGGTLDVRVDKSEGRVYLQGSAVLVMAGVLLNTSRL